MNPNEVQVVRLSETSKIELPQGSWSAMVISTERVSGNQSSLGYSVFTPGTALPTVKHEVEEVAIVLQGRGELRIDGDSIPYQKGDALFIPAGVWHSVVNTGSEDVVMVFGFPHPEYPPTKRRE
ncbi:MAG: cupin domain-containing protein [Candidatus Bipolaricaulia bacterium]